MLEWTEQSASSGMHFNHRAIPRMLQTNIIYKTLSMIFPFYYHLPPSLWLAINAITGTTSKYPHLFATPVNQINYYSLGSYPPEKNVAPTLFDYRLLDSGAQAEDCVHLSTFLVHIPTICTVRTQNFSAEIHKQI